MIASARRLHRRAKATTAIVALQALAAAFFLADLAGDVAEGGWDTHAAIEGLAAIALAIAVVMGALRVRSFILAARQDEAAVALAKGALADLVQLRFAEWSLTPAETEVALFALKGFDIGEIAALRSAATGTVRAQLARIYAKAGVDSHMTLLSMFLEDLIEMPTLSPRGAIPASVRDQIAS
jgi:DNA-binding NarL/FixJ family response regulator